MAPGMTLLHQHHGNKGRLLVLPLLLLLGPLTWLLSPCEALVHQQHQLELASTSEIAAAHIQWDTSGDRFRDDPPATPTPCPDTTLLRLTPIQWYLAYTCVAISGACLVLFVAERACRSGRLVWLYPGRTVHALAWTLLLAHLTFLVGAGRTEVPAVCTGVAATLHFLLLSAFFWLNVMCIDIFRCFFFITYRPVAGRLFLRSALYAWGVPAVVTFVAVGLDEIEDLPASATAPGAKPCFGRGGVCWFGSGGGFGLLFALPTCLLLLVDGLAFAAIVFWMRDSRADAALRQQEAAAAAAAAANGGEQAGSTPAATVQHHPPPRRATSLNPASLRRRRSSSISVREHHRFKVYIRLAIVLTLPWGCGIAAAIGDFPFLWYATVALMGLQGSFIFVAFGAKRRLTQLAWKKATGKPLRRRTTVKDHKEPRATQTSPDVSAQQQSNHSLEEQQQ